MKETKQQYSIRIFPSLKKKIQEKAKKDRRSANQTIEIAIEEYCKL